MYPDSSVHSSTRVYFIGPLIQSSYHQSLFLDSASIPEQMASFGQSHPLPGVVDLWNFCCSSMAASVVGLSCCRSFVILGDGSWLQQNSTQWLGGRLWCVGSSASVLDYCHSLVWGVYVRHKCEVLAFPAFSVSLMTCTFSLAICLAVERG